MSNTLLSHGDHNNREVVSMCQAQRTCVPIPLSRKPWKGKWSGPRAGAALTWTVPVSMASLIMMAWFTSWVKTQPCRGKTQRTSIEVSAHG